MPRKQHPASGEGDKNVVIFRCGPSGCLQYRIVNQSQVSAGNMDTLFNSLTGWNDVDDACAGGEAGDTFQANALTAAFESPDVVVLATDNNRVYQVSASDGLFYEIP